jgi:hypothetical protein
MGLGKTLTTIATILSTLKCSRERLADPDADKPVAGPNATLVVVTSARKPQGQRWINKTDMY